MSNLEDLLYDIYNEGLYDEVMDLYPKIRQREPYKEVEEVYQICYEIIKKNKDEKNSE